MSKETEQLQRIVEGALMAAGKPLNIQNLIDLFDAEQEEPPSKEQIKTALEDIQSDCKGRGFELKEIASGYRFQVIQEVAPWVSRMWDEKPQKYSRALLETLSLIAYRQPITRGDIEDIRGVAVSSHIVKTLLEREWVRVVGHKDVPGRPALYATTRSFLDYFNLKNLDELPTLAEIRDLDDMNGELSLEGADTPNMDAQQSEEAGSVDPIDQQEQEDAADGIATEAEPESVTEAEADLEAGAQSESADEVAQEELSEDGDQQSERAELVGEDDTASAGVEVADIEAEAEPAAASETEATTHTMLDDEDDEQAALEAAAEAALLAEEEFSR
ncbi:SMC-Scp complex subunit ScpB [Dasania sp. GY-MA-18]|uniref:SMC-Scp complex subunit ScpB n=1 Tax=Dasania phycosphaerae TaxID=2950436 RepID=A0A9J6RMS4_9GAMM|nr:MULTISPECIES: SMC-Scp complex subunit ScpB [Dasania]MCR8923348.1 SMC-Scp complex subunit ScpB [Dasania sp. GY-MA-18]MCZ0865780.1 SMC-Scp complex subunit ScpB [Dasania phycosphaerae]MCZ0869505.1 SMC-Scp complex subunit ScpB [Dasania phycosphaerae]